MSEVQSYSQDILIETCTIEKNLLNLAEHNLNLFSKNPRTAAMKRHENKRTIDIIYTSYHMYIFCNVTKIIVLLIKKWHQGKKKKRFLKS